ncbi:MAG: imidazole glycerol phosphate synthase subunit HisH [Sedimentisphaerales bacterium]|nr:imidazole glycerol phosphate synthase subunit HisH [Sedimentisphaerales bacterium]
MIVVIDYSVGNVKSVRNALDFLGIDDKLSADPDDIRASDGVILPGVAAFGYAMAELGDLAEVVREVAGAGKPLLGICVGHQLLFEHSCELGEHDGLGLIQGTIEPIPQDMGLTIPHMGWNAVMPDVGMNLFAGLEKEEYFYFAHSFCAKVTDPEAKVAKMEYGRLLVASVQKGNVFGVQFHPEKSAPMGLDVLRNFDAICREGGIC